MKKIPLTQGQFAIVDDHWFDYLNQWKWHALWMKDTQSYYAVRNDGKEPHRTLVLMHRIVARTPDDMQCDHIHHNTLDNREEELRNATRSQNTMNSKVRKDNKLGITGIHKIAGKESYRVQLRIKGKHVIAKNFPTLDAAIQARSDGIKKFFGEFANLNQIPKDVEL